MAGAGTTPPADRQVGACKAPRFVPAVFHLANWRSLNVIEIRRSCVVAGRGWPARPAGFGGA
jgi:hypothetical protein